jgi:hypothetical protein
VAVVDLLFYPSLSFGLFENRFVANLQWRQSRARGERERERERSFSFFFDVTQYHHSRTVLFDYSGKFLYFFYSVLVSRLFFILVCWDFWISKLFDFVFLIKFLISSFRLIVSYIWFCSYYHWGIYM